MLDPAFRLYQKSVNHWVDKKRSMGRWRGGDSSALSLTLPVAEWDVTCGPNVLAF